MPRCPPHSAATSRATRRQARRPVPARKGTLSTVSALQTAPPASVRRRAERRAVPSLLLPEPEACPADTYCRQRLHESDLQVPVCAGGQLQLVCLPVSDELHVRVGETPCMVVRDKLTSCTCLAPAQRAKAAPARGAMCPSRSTSAPSLRHDIQPARWAELGKCTPVPYLPPAGAFT
jgi:hypothetical protein